MLRAYPLRHRSPAGQAGRENGRAGAAVLRTGAGHQETEYLDGQKRINAPVKLARMGA
jgi:hypothetical protein